MINSNVISSCFLIFSGNAKARTMSFGKLLNSQETKAITGGSDNKKGATLPPEEDGIDIIEF